MDDDYTAQLNTTLAAPAANDKHRLNANTNNCREQRQVEEKYTQFILADLMLLQKFLFIFILMTRKSMKILVFILVEMKCFQSVGLQDATRDS